MTRDQLDMIPDRLLVPGRRDGCRDLIGWLDARGWQMTLEEPRGRAAPSGSHLATAPTHAHAGR